MYKDTAVSFLSIPLFSKATDRTIYLSFFRLFICFHYVKKLLLNWTSMGVMFGEESFYVFNTDIWPGYYIAFARSHYEIFALIFLVLLVLYAFGIGKHLTALAVFIAIFTGCTTNCTPAWKGVACKRMSHPFPEQS